MPRARDCVREHAPLEAELLAPRDFAREQAPQKADQAPLQEVGQAPRKVVHQAPQVRDLVCSSQVAEQGGRWAVVAARGGRLQWGATSWAVPTAQSQAVPEVQAPFSTRK